MAGQLNSDNQQNQHMPVLIEKILELAIANRHKGFRAFDGTFGGGGYSYRFLEAGGKVWSTDLDSDAISKTQNSVFFTQKIADESLFLTNQNFADYIKEFEDAFFDIIVVDLGFSSNQLEFSNRGFSYLKPSEPFDLRYNQSIGQPAYQKIGNLKEVYELRKIIYQNSGEEFATRISKNLFETISEQKKGQIVFVEEVVNLIKQTIPSKFSKKTNSILSRVWQAIRIWVNSEFESLKRFLEIAKSKLKNGGLLMVVCFHSLEDKMTTQYFRKLAKPLVIDEFGNTKQLFRLITKKPIVADQQELKQNPRSRSARLRVLQRI